MITLVIASFLEVRCATRLLPGRRLPSLPMERALSEPERGLSGAESPE
jgi:hypothetical protein